MGQHQSSVLIDYEATEKSLNLLGSSIIPYQTRLILLNLPLAGNNNPCWEDQITQ